MSWWAVIAGWCAVISIILSLVLIYQHLSRLTEPDIQKYIVRIVAMVPVYAATAFLEFMLPTLSGPVGALRDGYEAFVMYQFVNLLVSYLGGMEGTSRILEAKTELQPHFFPFTCLPPFRPNLRFLVNIKRGLIQFVVLKPLLSLFMGALSWGHPAPQWAVITTIVMENLSITIALYCLVLFYAVLKDDLAKFNPLPKFVCIKAILFFSYWQGLCIKILVALGIIPEDPDSDEITKQYMPVLIQSFIICCEMVIAAIAHMHGFSYVELYLNTGGSTIKTSLFRGVRDALSPEDVMEDTVKTFKPGGGGKRGDSVDDLEDHNEDLLGQNEENVNNTKGTSHALLASLEVKQRKLENDSVQHNVALATALSAGLAAAVRQDKHQQPEEHDDENDDIDLM